MKYSNENWFLYVDAREKDGLTHEHAVELLEEKGVSKEEIEAIDKAYQEWCLSTVFED